MGRSRAQFDLVVETGIEAPVVEEIDVGLGRAAPADVEPSLDRIPEILVHVMGADDIGNKGLKRERESEHDLVGSLDGLRHLYIPDDGSIVGGIQLDVEITERSGAAR